MLTNTVHRHIEWGDCDPAGIVFNPNYFRYFDHSTAMLYEVAGWPTSKMLETFGILGCVAVETTATFKAPCKWGDEVVIHSGIKEVGRSSFKIFHQLLKDNTVCTEGLETRVWTKADPETGIIKAAPIPEEVAKRFRGE